VAKNIKKQTKKRVKLELNGEFKTLNEWCKEYGINRGTVIRRLKHGYWLEEALTEPMQEPKKKKKPDGIRVTCNGKEYTSIHSLAKEYGLDVTTVYARYKRGIRGEALVEPPYGKKDSNTNGKTK
jgi:DNA invertase Pin-like site-specific DNA recombinase